MPSFRDLSAVVAHLSSRELPFAWYSMGPGGDDAIEFEVAPRDCAAATDYFAEHPLFLADGTSVTAVVNPRRGESWGSAPSEGLSGPSHEFDYESLVGRDVNEAAQQANLSGWIVRAHEREAVVTADYNPGRLNLCYGDGRVVESVHRG